MARRPTPSTAAPRYVGARLGDGQARLRPRHGRRHRARRRLSPGLVHYHFESKLEILVAAVHALVATHARGLDAAHAGKDDAPAQLVAFIDIHLGLGAHADPDALACWVLMMAEALREGRAVRRRSRSRARRDLVK